MTSSLPVSPCIKLLSSTQFIPITIVKGPENQVKLPNFIYRLGPRGHVVIAYSTYLRRHTLAWGEECFSRKTHFHFFNNWKNFGVFLFSFFGKMIFTCNNENNFLRKGRSVPLSTQKTIFRCSTNSIPQNVFSGENLQFFPA